MGALIASAPPVLRDSDRGTLFFGGGAGARVMCLGRDINSGLNFVIISFLKLVSLTWCLALICS